MFFLVFMLNLGHKVDADFEEFDNTDAAEKKRVRYFYYFSFKFAFFSPYLVSLQSNL